MRTRVKFCGFTRADDVRMAAALGVDAVGFVMYPSSPRYVAPEQVRALCADVPALVGTVGLFVNETAEQIAAVLEQTGLQIVQLHGDESFDFAAQLQRDSHHPVIKAVRVNSHTDWAEVEHYIDQLAGILLDSDSTGYGGSGHGFEWNAIPHSLRARIILSGGLTADNVAQAIEQVQPHAVDVSSGIEAGKGIKDAEKMQAFIAAL